MKLQRFPGSLDNRSEAARMFPKSLTTLCVGSILNGENESIFLEGGKAEA